MGQTPLNVTVVGPGAIGGTVAAWLSQDPQLCLRVATRTPFERLRIETPGGVIEAQPQQLTEPAQAAPADWVLIATKTYDAAATKSWLARLVNTRTRVAVLQNGVEHMARFADALPAERIVPVVVDIPAERLAPGRVRQRGVGTMIVPAGPNGEAFTALFAHTPIVVSATADFVTAAWMKLALNCAGAVNAITRKAAGIAARDDVADVMRTLVRECIAVGHAEGALLDEGLEDRVIAHYRGGPADAVNSLHADFVAGRPMELDARNGVIVRLGRRHGVATPANAMIVTLLESASAHEGSRST